MISDSKFHMWRALFALAHADLVVTQEERIFMKGVMDSLDLSDDQRAKLEGDMGVSQDAAKMFEGITSDDDKNEFFHIAYNITWIDGEHNIDEERMLAKLKAKHEREKNAGEDLDFELDFTLVETPQDDGLQALLNNLRKNREGSS